MDECKDCICLKCKFKPCHDCDKCDMDDYNPNDKCSEFEEIGE